MFASDFSGVFDLFRYVLLAPFLGFGLAIGVFIGLRISSGRNRVVGPLVLMASAIVVAFLFTWTGSEFINLLTR